MNWASTLITKLLAFLDANPEYYPLIVWPLVTAVISFAQDQIKRRSPKVWAFFETTGLDALGFLRKFFPRVFPPAKPPATPPVDDRALKTDPSPPPDIASMRRTHAWGAPLAPMVLLFFVGCSPAQWQEAKTGIGAGLKIAGAVCEATGNVTDDGWLDYACRVVNAGADVLNNMSTGVRLDPSITTGGASVIVVQVHPDLAGEFERVNGGP